VYAQNVVLSSGGVSRTLDRRMTTEGCRHRLPSRTRPTGAEPSRGRDAMVFDEFLDAFDVT
jgi:hypothetical protein